MKGSIGYDPKMGRFYVSWYHGGKTHKIWFYNGIKLEHRSVAEQLLAVMRGDEQRKAFRLERYLHQRSEIGPLADKWLSTVIAKRAPSTQASYRAVMHRHIRPFFDRRRVSLSEIDYSILMELNAAMELSENSKKVAFRILKSFLVYAQKAGRIDALPIFPSRDDFSPEVKPFNWIPEARQIRVIEAVPEPHQPIFWWLKYHMRRPAEACALMKSDFQDDIFTIRRTFSGDKLHDTTKHKRVSYVPIVEAFRPVYERFKKDEGRLSSPYFFVNPQGRTKDRHYTVGSLRDRWKAACKKVGEDIAFYHGVKRSSATQLINEHGMNEYDVQVALDCSLTTVKSYARAEVKARKAILDKVFNAKKERTG